MLRIQKIKFSLLSFMYLFLSKTLAILKMACVYDFMTELLTGAETSSAAAFPVASVALGTTARLG
jgi:hypothetical protein